MDRERKIRALLATSRDVLRDVALPNGAIVAANSDAPYYPREASDYRYVWPRDASFVCVAADRLGLSLAEPFFRWLDEKPEDFVKERLLYANYATNGRLGTLGHVFEPDQMGSVLWALGEHVRDRADGAAAFEPLIRRLADGLAAAWNHTAFVPNAVDVWEGVERKTSSRMHNNFTYSLAACARGLLIADGFFPTADWRETAQTMLHTIDQAYHHEAKTFVRNQGKIVDWNVDASLLGLLWPFRICEASDYRFRETVERIERALIVRGGVHRFEFDYFDSEGAAWEGGGAWPVLNFWLAIVYHQLGERAKALAAYDWVLERVETYLPEQIFDDFRVGIYPLAWSHALFVLATDELGLRPAAP